MIDIKKIQKNIKIKFSSNEELKVIQFIKDNIKIFERFKNFNTEKIEILSLPYERKISFENLREDIPIPDEENLIKLNSNSIDKQNYLIYKSETELVKKNSKINSKLFNPILRKINLKISNNSSNILNGSKIAIKDNISTLTSITTGGTLLLEKFYPNYNATIVDKILDAGGNIIAKTNLDELAMGGAGVFSPYGIVHNYFNPKHIIGGSSSGSAYVVSAGIADIAIGTDTGDSVRKPAGYAGVVGFKPTYGIVSRYGVFDYSPSLDHVAWFSKDVSFAAKMLDVLSSKDNNDMNSIKSIEKNYFKNLSSDISKYKIGVLPKKYLNFKNKDIEKNYFKSIENLNFKVSSINEIDFDINLLKIMYPVYQAISFTEAVSCNSNLQGIIFGIPGRGSDQITDSRTNGLGIEVKKRFAIGSFMLNSENQEKYFKKAKKIRRLIVNEYNRVMKNYDAIIFPTSENNPPLIKNINSFTLFNKSDFIEEIMLISNFSGSPSISIPNGNTGEFKSSININSKIFEDQKVLNIAKFLEEKTNE